ncbi:MAG: PAS domain-containing sensor histidine kinase [Chloroflexi bacterium]|nr:MAG: PAS domain-containing sensor histidine kinase [Chloroflexota bacterium]
MSINFWLIIALCITIVLIIALTFRNQAISRKNQALARQVTELNPVMALNEDGILLLDTDFKVVTTNKAFAEVVNLCLGEMVGKTAVSWPENTPSILSRLNFDLNFFQNACDSMASGANRQKETITIYGPPDDYFERTLCPVFDHEKLTGWLLMLHDVTEAHALAQMREDMTHMLVHDLRSPLAVMLGSIETAQVWLENNRLDETDRLFEIARSSGQRLLGLLNDLLDMYKLESGELDLVPEPIPISMLLTEAKTQLEPLAEDAGIDIEIDLEPDLPLLTVDVGYLKRAVINLLDNAVKYAPDNGRIRLWSRMDFVSNEKPTMLIGISDNGPGIRPDLHRQIFKKFRHDRRQRRQRRGTGLGLPYCKLVVEAHNGRIWVESDGTYKTGSTFIMQLPVVGEQIPV